MQEKFKVFNKSSENMSEIESSSIDLAIADPPWNVGLKYDLKIDNASHKEYSEMMQRVISEINRVLKEEGEVLIILPKKVRKNNQIFDYPKLFTDLFKKSGLTNKHTFSFLVKEEDFTCLPANKIKEKGEDCHSEEICGLVFTKNRKKISNFPKNKKYIYIAREGHPCPYPPELVQDILDTFYVGGSKVLDPFMGTAGLGEAIIQRCGTFYGYEIEPKYYNLAKEKLRRLN